MMRPSHAEKMEIIHLVEHSDLPITRTLDELGRASQLLLPLVPEVAGRWLRRVNRLQV
jgi:hypothetical protein